MKQNINALIVVEGVSDVQFLESFLEADFCHTNGSAILKSTIDLILAAKAKGKEVIVLTDPDFPGEKIRESLSRQIPGLSHAFIPKKQAISRGKVGVAEATEAVVLQALKDKLVPHKEVRGSLKPHELSELGLVGLLDSKFKRQHLVNYFHLGECNVKTMVKRLNFLGISYDEIAKALQNQ
jgi:ribonuclease M5